MGDVCPDCGYVRGAPAEELYFLYPGTILDGRYMIGKALGAGGFGIVYKAWDGLNNRPVAIKEYYPSGLVTRTPGAGQLRLVARSRTEEFMAGRERFAAERSGTMRIDARCSDNPNLLHGVAQFDDNDTLYMAMEFIEGITLTEYIETNGHMDVQDGLRMITEVLGAVRDIHKEGVIHRDISPDNIIVQSDGSIKLFDFGAAKFGKGDKSIAAERVMKPGYSPPEQYEPDGVTGVHTDIYAVGATLYFALTGLKPDEATNRKDGDLMASPQSLNPEVPENVSEAILKSMAIDYRMRFTSAEDFRKALHGEAKVLRPEKELRRRKFRRIATVAAAFVILLVGGAVAYLQLREQVPMLRDAEIELWYIVTGDDFIDRQKESGLEEAIRRFNIVYPNVEINLYGISASRYEAEVAAAIRQSSPVLFESNGLSAATLSGARDVSAVASSVSGDTRFLDAYTRLFPERNQMPTGFVVPCVYLNTSLARTFEGGVADDLTALLASLPAGQNRIAVQSGHEGGFAAAFGVVSYADEAEFFNDDAGALYSDTSQLRRVQSTHVGRYRLLRLDSPDVPVTLSGLYSVAGGTRDEVAALMRFLEFMFDEGAQDALHIQYSSGLIPLNVSAFNTFRDLFPDFQTFFDNVERYVAR